jgi:transposase-like protein
MAKGKYEYWLTPDGLLLIEAWARDGLTDEQIAHNLGVAYSTLRVWRDKYSALSAALKRGKEVVDIQVENALLKRALGYQYKEVKTEESEGEDGPVKKVTTTVKEVVPDTTAQIFWLKNRKPDVWRDKQNVELSGEVKTANPYESLTTDELKKLIRDG